MVLDVKNYFSGCRRFEPQQSETYRQMMETLPPIIDTASAARNCSSCPQQANCFLAQPLPDERGKCAGIVRRSISLPRNERLFHRGSAFGFVYIVCDGSLKTQLETRNGDLVITGFHFPGDILGIDAIADGVYPCDAMATSDSRICQLNFSRLLSQCADDPRLHQWVISRISKYLQCRDNDLCWSISLPAHKRVLRFFLNMYERLSNAGCAYDSSSLLPMRKQDIARYLHITPETLSRNLGQLRRQDLLVVEKHRFRLPNKVLARELTQF